VSAIFDHNSLLRLLPKSYFKISTFQPYFLCSSSFKYTQYINFSKGIAKFNANDVVVLLLLLLFVCLFVFVCFLLGGGVVNKKQNKNRIKQESLPEPGIESGTSRTAVWFVTSGPTGQLININVSIEVNTFKGPRAQKIGSKSTYMYLKI